MEIKSGNGYPSSALSNFAPHPFELDGVKIASMEGFLQSLKFENPDMQAHVCSLVGAAAKRMGKYKNWQDKQILYWRGVKYERDRPGYQNLLYLAYHAMFDQSESFRNALKAAGKDAVFTHSMGRKDPSETVLTRREFCKLLTHFRDKIFKLEN